MAEAAEPCIVHLPGGRTLIRIQEQHRAQAEAAVGVVDRSGSMMSGARQISARVAMRAVASTCTAEWLAFGTDVGHVASVDAFRPRSDGTQLCAAAHGILQLSTDSEAGKTSAIVIITDGEAADHAQARALLDSTPGFSVAGRRILLVGIGASASALAFMSLFGADYALQEFYVSCPDVTLAELAQTLEAVRLSAGTASAPVTAAATGAGIFGIGSTARHDNASVLVDCDPVATGFHPSHVSVPVATIRDALTSAAVDFGSSRMYVPVGQSVLVPVGMSLADVRINGAPVAGAAAGAGGAASGTGAVAALTPALLKEVVDASSGYLIRLYNGVLSTLRVRNLSVDERGFARSSTAAVSTDKAMEEVNTILTSIRLLAAADVAWASSLVAAAAAAETSVELEAGSLAAEVAAAVDAAVGGVALPQDRRLKLSKALRQSAKPGMDTLLDVLRRINALIAGPPSASAVQAAQELMDDTSRGQIGSGKFARLQAKLEERQVMNQWTDTEAALVALEAANGMSREDEALLASAGADGGDVNKAVARAGLQAALALDAYAASAAESAGVRECVLTAAEQGCLVALGVAKRRAGVAAVDPVCSTAVHAVDGLTFELRAAVQAMLLASHNGTHIRGSLGTQLNAIVGFWPGHSAFGRVALSAVLSQLTTGELTTQFNGLSAMLALLHGVATMLRQPGRRDDAKALALGWAAVAARVRGRCLGLDGRPDTADVTTAASLGPTPTLLTAALTLLWRAVHTPAYLGGSIATPAVWAALAFVSDTVVELLPQLPALASQVPAGGTDPLPPTFWSALRAAHLCRVTRPATLPAQNPDARALYEEEAQHLSQLCAQVPLRLGTRIVIHGADAEAGPAEEDGSDDEANDNNGAGGAAAGPRYNALRRALEAFSASAVKCDEMPTGVPLLSLMGHPLPCAQQADFAAPVAENSAETRFVDRVVGFAVRQMPLFGGTLGTRAQVRAAVMAALVCRGAWKAAVGTGFTLPVLQAYEDPDAWWGSVCAAQERACAAQQRAAEEQLHRVVSATVRGGMSVLPVPCGFVLEEHGKAARLRLRTGALRPVIGSFGNEAGVAPSRATQLLGDTSCNLISDHFLVGCPSASFEELTAGGGWGFMAAFHASMTVVSGMCPACTDDEFGTLATRVLFRDRRFERTIGTLNANNAQHVAHVVSMCRQWRFGSRVTTLLREASAAALESMTAEQLCATLGVDASAPSSPAWTAEDAGLRLLCSRDGEEWSYERMVIVVLLAFARANATSTPVDVQQLLLLRAQHFAHTVPLGTVRARLIDAGVAADYARSAEATALITGAVIANVNVKRGLAGLPLLSQPLV